jgi:hypothetical protein
VGGGKFYRGFEVQISLTFKIVLYGMKPNLITPLYATWYSLSSLSPPFITNDCDKLSTSIGPLINCQTVSVSFQCPDSFVVGYGMDYAELYRNLPYVGVLKPEMYNKKTSN